MKNNRDAARTGVRLEIFTVAWMLMEAAVAIGAGIAAGSLLLIAFGFDSVIELVSGVVLLWRLLIEVRGNNTEAAKWAEYRASWIVGVALALLCLYVLGSATYGFVTHSQPESSPVGIGISAAALVMPGLWIAKRRIAKRLDSAALRGDAASSLTCGYMAGTVLVGLVLNAVFGWWWAEDVAALVFLFWLVGETREALEEAWEG